MHISGMRFVMVSAVLTATLSGCGSGSDAADRSAPVAPAPKPIDVTVDLHDGGSLDLLFNQGEGVCTSVNFGQTLTGGESPPVRVELRNADDKLVGTQRLPKVGGTFSRSAGCTWNVTFYDMPAGDLYQAKITNGQDSYTGSGSARHVRIDF